MMTAEQLKTSILQMAMQGKLVEQRADEGTGEDLYKIILEERQRLVKGGKIKKEKEQKEKTEDAPFDIPESWKWARLNDIVSKTIKRGKSPRYAQKSNTLVFAQKCNTKAGIIDLSLCLFLDDNHLSKYSEEEFMLDKDIVINSTGNGTLGRVNIYRDTDNPQGIPIVPDSHVTVIRCNRHMDVGYVLHCLKYYQPYMEKLGSGSTNQTELGAGIIKELAFPIPPLEEQKRIVAKIEELMPFVEQYAVASTKLNKLNATFPEMMKKSILQEAVQGKLVPQDPNDEPASVLLKKIRKTLPKQKPCKDDLNFDSMDFEIPDNWEWAELNELFNFVDYRGKTPHKTNHGVFLITASNIRQGFMEYTRKEYISEEEYEDRQSRGITHKGDLIFTTEAPMGNAAICDLDKCSCGQRIITFQPFCDETLVPELYMYFILCPAFQKQLLANCTGTTAKGIKADKLKHFRIPLPPLNEQKRILEKIKLLVPQIDTLGS